MRVERRADAEDIDRLSAIRGAVRENVLSDPSSVTRADYAWFVTQGWVWVAEIEGRIVGFSASDGRNGSIWALFVAAGHHGKGIGAALLDRACTDLKDAGYAKASLSTDPGTHAERLYRRLGWIDRGMQADGERRFERLL